MAGVQRGAETNSEGGGRRRQAEYIAYRIVERLPRPGVTEPVLCGQDKKKTPAALAGVLKWLKASREVLLPAGLADRKGGCGMR